MSQSPELSGNAGTTYETQVAAFFMSAVLVDGGALGLDGAVAKSVAVQRKALGDPLDDVVVVGLRNDGSEAKLQLQAKTKIIVSATNGDFRAIVAASWEAMNDPAFQDGRDRFGAVTQSVAVEKRRNLRRLHDDARYSTDATEFAAKVTLRGKGAKDVYADILAALTDAAGRAPTKDEEWRFFRHFIAIEIRTTGDDSQERHSATERLRGGLAPSDRLRAPLLFDALDSIARSMNRSAGKVDAEILGDLLAGQFAFHPDVAADSVEQLTLRAREAAQADLAGFITQRDGAFATTVRPFFLAKPDDQDDAQLSLEAYALKLAIGASGLLMGRPGAGKSTSLIHLATELLEAHDTVVPILVPLPEYGGGSLIDEALRRPRFRAMGQEGLERLASAGRIVLLCDAWNEVPPAKRDAIKTALTQFSRNHTESAILVASRAGAAYPLSDNKQEVWLSPMSRDQQLALLTDLVGEKAERLLADATQTKGLSDLIQTPFYLSALGKLTPAGQLPSTRDQLIAGLMAEYENRVAGRDAFYQTLRGVHIDVLRALGSELVRRATTSLSDSEMRSFVSSCSQSLQAKGQIAAPLEPAATIASLVDHHILTRNQLTETVNYALPHEQIQEWLASFEVEHALRTIASDEDRQRFLATYLNDPRWTEAVLFATERLGRDAPTAGLAARVVAWALGIDRQFAAQIIERAGDTVWSKISSLVERYIAAWTASDTLPSESELVAFLTTCGREELGSALWTVLEGDVGGHSLHHIHASNLLRMLRAEWGQRFAGLAPQQRRALLYDLVSWGPPEAVEWSLNAAVGDPVLDVLYGIVNLLEYGQSGALDDYTDRIAPEMWAQLAKRVSIRELEPGSFGERLIVEKIKVLETETDAAVRRRLLAELAEGGVDVDLDELVRMALDDPEHPSELTLAALKEWAPRILSKALVQRIETQTQVNSTYFEAILPEDAPSQDRLVELGTFPKAIYGTQEMAGRLLEEPTITDLLDRILAMHREDGWDEPMRERHRALGELISNTRIEALLSALEAFRDIDAPTAEILTERLLQWRQARGHRDEVLSPPARARISALIAAWAIIALSETCTYRPVLAHLVQTIQVFGLDEHLDVLVALTRKESALWQAEEQAFLVAWNNGRPNGHVQRPMTYGMFRNAFQSIEGDRVSDVLVSLLDDPLFGEDAAVSLRRFAGVELPAPGVLSPTYDGFAERRAQLQANASKPPHPLARLIIDRINPFIASSEKKHFDQALALTRALALMDFGDRFELIDQVLRDERADRRSRLSVLECLKIRGAVLPDDLVLTGLDASITERLEASWSSDNDWWEVRQWIVLAAFMTTPSAALPLFGRLPDYMKHAHRFDDFISALGQAATEKSLATLQALLRDQPNVGDSFAWARACGQLKTIEAFELLAAIVTERLSAGQEIGSGVVHALEQFLEGDHALAGRLLDRSFWRDEPKAQALIARVLGRRISEDLALRLFELTDAQGKGPFAEALIQGADELGVRRDPIDGTMAYDLTPIRLDRFKRRLAAEVFNDQGRAGLAKELLVRVDQGRLYYGRPADDPRHPDITQRRAWPAFAGFAWAEAESL
ncbi:MAG: hypothetical protein IE910_01110 [Brevundimonas sp.]|nr:hypothetical protein [Brevundimonas sp.]